MANNPQNLIRNEDRTPEERRRNAAKAGRASGKARLKKKQGRELLRALLSMKEPDPRILCEMEALGIAPSCVTYEVAMHARQIDKAIKKADTAAYAAVYKAAGYEKQEFDIKAVVTRPRVVFEGDEEDAIQD